jgi:hypothetical protein
MPSKVTEDDIMWTATSMFGASLDTVRYLMFDLLEFVGPNLDTDVRGCKSFLPCNDALPGSHGRSPS